MYAAARHDQHAASSAISGPRTTAAPFTALELRVLHLAASGSERPSTVVEPIHRRIARRVANVVMAQRGGRDLADPRLEALRSYGASVRLGRTDSLPLFFAAGYTAAQAHDAKRIVAEEARRARHRPARRDTVMYASGVSIGLASILGFVAMTGSLLAGM